MVARTSILNAFLQTSAVVSQSQSTSLVVRLYATAGFVMSVGFAGGVTNDVDVYTCWLQPSCISVQVLFLVLVLLNILLSSVKASFHFLL